MGLVCHLLTGEGYGTLQSYCPQFRGVIQSCRRSYCLHTWDAAEHLRFVNPWNFKILAIPMQLDSLPHVSFTDIGVTNLW